jgi:hypothetical protein
VLSGTGAAALVANVPRDTPETAQD